MLTVCNNDEKSERAINFSEKIASYINPAAFQIDTFDIHFEKAVSENISDSLKKIHITKLYSDLITIKNLSISNIKELNKIEEFDEKYQLKALSISFLDTLISVSQNEMFQIVKIIEEDTISIEKQIQFDKLTISFYKKLSKYYKESDEMQEKFSKKYNLNYTNQYTWKELDEIIAKLKEQVILFENNQLIPNK